jgi:P27 family predicted phage terminase small subunit
MPDTAAVATEHLSAWSKRWVAGILGDAGETATDTDRKLLVLAAEAADTAATARRLVRREGIVFTDRLSNIRAHPAVAIEREARAAFSRIVAQLGLDVHASAEPRGTYRGRNGRTYTEKGGA